MWKIVIHNKVAKQLKKLPESVVLVTQLLTEDLKHNGPYPGKGWPNYGKLKCKSKKDLHHCHLMKGNPTYVACWEILNKRAKLIEVYYVGTHERAPY